MSFTCDIQLRCDGCWRNLNERKGVVGLADLQMARSSMQYIFNREYGMTTKMLRRRTQHLCHVCADSAPAQGKRGPR